jgi:hypothetical protein
MSPKIIDDTRSVAAEPIWNMYRGRPNNGELLQEKALIVAEIISIILESGEQLAAPWSTKFGKAEALLARAEISAYWLHIVDKYFAFRLLSPSGRNTFMSTLEQNIAEKLRGIGLDRSAFLDLLQARYAEYAAFKEMVPKDGESAKGTLNWEFAKKVAAVLGIGKSALFNMTLSIKMLRHLRNAELGTLLKG